jgi:hypothetical protein
MLKEEYRFNTEGQFPSRNFSSEESHPAPELRAGWDILVFTAPDWRQAEKLLLLLRLSPVLQD